MEHFFAYTSRMRFISRWALMRNSQPENIQEHSHQVAVLAHALAVIRNRCFGGQVDPGTVAVAALYHDASEILTGDMPTPIKYYNPAIRDAYKQVEHIACGKLVGMLPPELQPDFAEALTPHRPGGGDAGEGGGQAGRPYQVLGGAEGRKSGVPPGGGADRAGVGRFPSAGADLFPGAFPPQLPADAG